MEQAKVVRNEARIHGVRPGGEEGGKESPR
jgi:hypothetical protein